MMDPWENLAVVFEGFVRDAGLEIREGDVERGIKVRGFG